jgi:glycosyltransferase involved in cell wall biosynthesis
MRICVVYDCLFPYTIGGGERWFRNLAERLAAEGHEVTYLTLRQWERGTRLDLDERVRVITAGPRMALYTESGRRRIVPPLVFGLGVLWHMLRRGRQYDVVHTCAFPYFSLLSAAVARRRGRYRLEVDWFEVWSDDYWRDYLGGLGGRIGALVQRLCARVRQRAFCFSELHGARLREEGLRGTLTVLRGLYAEQLEPAEHSTETSEESMLGDSPPVTSSPAEPLVLFAGRLIAEKQATLGVAAIALAVSQVENLRGEFLGDGPERAALLRAIEEHGLGARVAAPGFTDAATVDREMRRAMCMLLPSRREGYGMVVVEAAARGTPSVVVAGEDNAATELIEEGVNGTVAERSDPQAIAEAIVRIHAGGAELRRRTAAWFEQNAERLSIDASLRTVAEGYVEGGPSRPEEAATPGPSTRA